MSLTTSVDTTSMGVLNPCCWGWKRLWSPEGKLPTCTACWQEKFSASPPSPGDTSQLLIPYPSPSSFLNLVWKAWGDLLSGAGGCQIHPHHAEKQIMHWDPWTPHPMDLLQLPWKIREVLRILLAALRDGFFTSIALTATDSLQGPSCNLVTLVSCSLKGRKALVREHWE